jgi:hypothetical protein
MDGSTINGSIKTFVECLLGHSVLATHALKVQLPVDQQSAPFGLWLFFISTSSYT